LKFEEVYLKGSLKKDDFSTSVLGKPKVKGFSPSLFGKLKVKGFSPSFGVLN